MKVPARRSAERCFFFRPAETGREKILCAHFEEKEVIYIYIFLQRPPPRHPHTSLPTPFSSHLPLLYIPPHRPQKTNPPLTLLGPHPRCTHTRSLVKPSTKTLGLSLPLPRSRGSISFPPPPTAFYPFPHAFSARFERGKGGSTRENGGVWREWHERGRFPSDAAPQQDKSFFYFTAFR